jgi:rRNA small subunit pseudouridine methyltransferase Nep1
LPLTFILAETALETVPKAILNHPSVIARARTKGKEPSRMLLDRTYHHNAMLRLPNGKKRGRPDIAHVTLLEILSSPLNKEGRLRTYVHTVNDYIIEVDDKTRLPRNYSRFVGLMEKLFLEKRVPHEGDPLLVLRKMRIKQLVEMIQPTFTVAFSSIGTPISIREVCNELTEERRPVVVVGGFPHGHFTKATSSVVDKTISVYHKPLDAWVIASRVVYEYEVSAAR